MTTTIITTIFSIVAYKLGRLKQQNYEVSQESELEWLRDMNTKLGKERDNLKDILELRTNLYTETIDEHLERINRLRESLVSLDGAFAEGTKIINNKNVEIQSLKKLLASKMDFEKEIVDLGDKTKVKRGWRADWKVTPKVKSAIKKATGTQEQIAKRFNISRSRVGQIRREK